MTDLQRLFDDGEVVSIVFRPSSGIGAVMVRRATVEHLKVGVRFDLPDGVPDDQKYEMTVERPGRLPEPLGEVPPMKSGPKEIVLAP